MEYLETIGMAGGLLYAALMLLFIISGWKLFEKAGKPGWACLIPIYSTIVLLEIVGKPWYWLLLMLIPGVGLVLGIWMLNLLSKSFGHGVGFTLGLLFLMPIFYPILGLGSSTYKGPAGT